MQVALTIQEARNPNPLRRSWRRLVIDTTEVHVHELLVEIARDVDGVISQSALRSFVKFLTIWPQERDLVCRVFGFPVFEINYVGVS